MPLIVSKIQRKGGSLITVKGTDYHFRPEGPRGEHVCEVDNLDHAKRLLSIPEGFHAFDPAEAAALAPAAPSPEARLENEIEPGGNDSQDGGEDETENGPVSTLEINIEPDQDDGLEELSDLDLSHAYKDVFDKAPPKNMKPATIITRIRAANAKSTKG